MANLNQTPEQNKTNQMLINLTNNVNSYLKNKRSIAAPPSYNANGGASATALPNPLYSINNIQQPTPFQAAPHSFLMKNEFSKQFIPSPAITYQNNSSMPINEQIYKNNFNNQIAAQLSLNSSGKNLRSESPIKTMPSPSTGLEFQGLEKKVEYMNEKLSKLETRVDKNEQITLNTQSDVKDIKFSLDKNFNKLDVILEKLASKLK
jgi:hypothetical protein